eukprot:TRINITY_DN14350_c0_g1_i1.p1 TRINITY_DN14350_c0_g1~~TRINITY_DN14350_c0_g1_i1.p1  ORF type:complete len:475 (+),score=133.50 TRINITY_DN14350_c0_g1_i1:179-1426(+)
MEMGDKKPPINERVFENIENDIRIMDESKNLEEIESLGKIPKREKIAEEMEKPEKRTRTKKSKEVEDENKRINDEIDRVINQAKGLKSVPDKLAYAPESIKNFKSIKAKQPRSPKSLTVSVIGLPNAGKSTLLNLIMNTKIAAVSPRQQTTRENTLGIYTEKNKQIEFTDTPGIVPKEKAKRIKNEIINAPFLSMKLNEQVLLVIDGTEVYNYHLHQVLEHIVKFYQSKESKNEEFLNPIVVFNKIDAIDPLINLFPLIREVKKEGKGYLENQFLVSALNGTNVDLLKTELLNRAVPREWTYNKQYVTDHSTLRRVHEVVREKLYLYLHQELPYTIVQKNHGWTEAENGTLFIDQTLYVPKASQIKIVNGIKGSVLNKIREDATKDIQSILGRSDVVVRIHVACKKNLPEPDYIN